MIHPLSGFEPGPLTASVAAQVGLAAPVSRFALRARGDVSHLAEALAMPLPSKVGHVATSPLGKAVRLGPDEWVLKTTQDDLEASSARVYATTPHSLVDVSGREVTFEISGPRALDLLTIGMARDPEAIPVGDARRVNFDGVTVLLWRLEERRFEMDIWHSFAPHILELLKTGTAELAAEMVARPEPFQSLPR